jgi:2-amino-4-hydroxy-6-hydroxymethyldihydropteridine diphosphokinase
VVRLETPLSAQALLAVCLGIERAQGRVRPVGGSKASRIIDVDVLLCDDQAICEPDLCVPHPRLLQRPFVRIPLAEVAQPGLRHPTTGEPLDCCQPDPTVVLVTPGRGR